MSVFVTFHLRQDQDGILTLGAMIMSLLAIMRTTSHRTKLGRSVLFKAGCHDGVKLLMLPPMSHNFVGVCAIIVTLQTMEMAAGLLSISSHRNFSVQSVEFTIRSSTRDASEALKLFTTEGI
jgi:hypothetical protein